MGSKKRQREQGEDFVSQDTRRIAREGDDEQDDAAKTLGARAMEHGEDRPQAAQ